MKRFYISSLLLFAVTIGKAQLCVGTPGEVKWQAWNDLYEGEFSELTAVPTYPHKPDVEKTLFRLKSSTNYNNFFGSRVRGYLSVPSTSSVQFNVTGDDEVHFYLSTDESPENKTLHASVATSVGEEEHDEFPEQTSGSITLVQGQFYYFEILNVDRYGSDRFSIWWKTDLVDPNEWRLVTAAYINGIACLDPECPESGLLCDDGDPTTSDDIQDGNCNCFGTKESTDLCIGERGKLTGYRYDNIPGGSLNDLYEAENFPGMPVSSETYEFFSKRESNDYDQQGFAVQAYLTVPISGNYKFNVTGDDNTILFLSSDASPENKQAHQALVTSWTEMTEHDKFIYQSTSNIYLEKGQYYYIEINLKESGGGEHFSAFWQTPFSETDTWKRIPAIYFYDYDCEIACIPENTSCDDGDPYTNNDMYDANCDCVGIPCSGPDCDSPLAYYVPFEKCGLTDQLDNRADNNWLACEKNDNPNNIRGEGHWIMYDLAQRHELYGSQIWNYNVANNLAAGMTAVAIDFSLDGNTWQEYGTYNWALATGDSGYGGFSGPNFNGLYAQYILITSLDVSATCKGLGKVAFSAVVCPLSGTLCDDTDDYTFDDKYDDNCDCKGSQIDENDCGEENVVLGDSTLYTNKYSAIQEVTSISRVGEDSRVSFVGGNAITLEPGFETDGQTLFLASIDPCDTPAMRALIKNRQQILADENEKRQKEQIDVLTVLRISEEEVLVSYYVEKPGQVKLSINTITGLESFVLINHEFENQGLYRKRFRTKRLDGSNHTVNLTFGDQQLSKAIPKDVVPKE